jgi:2'-hydroxyisoflavone reductase
MLTRMTTTPPPPANGRDLLVLGGTSWVGGAVARTALARGHRVTCLARGEAGDPPAGVTWVRADRAEAGAYDDVTGSRWDVVVEVSWQPELVRGALEALSAAVEHWVYVSSGSVYADEDVPDADETAPLHEPHRDPGPVGVEQYSGAKVACERLVVDAMGAERSLLARAGLIGGDGDRSDRLGYWPARIARADDLDTVLVPPRSAPVQVIDVEDLAEWLVLCAEQRVAGAYNAVGDPTTVGAVLDDTCAAAGRVPDFVEADDAWLREHGVEPWAGPESLALWLPQPEYAGFAARRNDAAKAAGLQVRPLAATLEATLAWELELGLERPRKAGLTPARERELLDRLRAGQPGPGAAQGA